MADNYGDDVSGDFVSVNVITFSVLFRVKIPDNELMQMAAFLKLLCEVKSMKSGNCRNDNFHCF